MGRLRQVLGVDAEAETNGGVLAHLNVVGEGGDAAVVDFALLFRKREITVSLISPCETGINGY